MSAVAADSCSCPSSGDFEVINGDVCEISTTCDIGSNSFRVLNGKMRITSTGKIIANGGCFVKDDESLFVEDGGGLFCG